MKKKLIGLLIIVALAVSFSACHKAEIELRFTVDGTSYRIVATDGRERIEMPEDPSKEGFTFGGWFWDRDTWLLPFTADSLLDTPISASVSVYAKWDAIFEEPLRYDLKGIAVKNSILGDDWLDPAGLTPEQAQQYDSVLSAYGKTVEIDSTSMKFDGLLLGAYSPANYVLNGTSVAFENETLKDTFTSVTLANGVLSLGMAIDGNGIALEYYAQNYVAPSYRIAFDYNGATDRNDVDAIDVAFHTAVGALPAPLRTGYTFAGWFYDGVAVGQSTPYHWEQDITVTADWTANVYQIRLEYNAADNGDSMQDKSVTFDSAVGFLPQPLKTNYRFAGWYSEDNGDGERIDAETIWNFDRDRQIYAYWVGEERTVNFEYEGATAGNDLPSKTVAFGDVFGELPCPTKSGNTFLGWYAVLSGQRTDVDCETVCTLTDPVTLYAKWQTEIVFDYQDATDGNTQNSMTAIYGFEIEPLPSPTRDGFSFAGWYTERSGRGSRILAHQKAYFARETVLYAKWTASITFDYQNATSGTDVTEKAVTWGYLMPNLPAPTRKGYRLGGWFSQPHGGGASYSDKAVFDAQNGSLTLYAYWIANTYTLNYESEGGTEVSPLTVTYDAAIGVMPMPIKEGNAFGGWYSRYGGEGEKYTADTVYAADRGITLYAKWTTELIFDYDGATGENATESVAVVYRSKIPVLPRPLKDGYSFEGWHDGRSEYLAGETFHSHTPLTLTAKWVKGTDKTNFIYLVSDAGVEITGLTAKGKELSEIAIPQIIDARSVVSVAEKAFSDETRLLRATVPDSVTVVGEGAFQGTSLIEIAVPLIGRSRSEANVRDGVLGSIFGYKAVFNDAAPPAGTTFQHQTSVNGFTTKYYYYIPATLRKVSVTDTAAVPESAFRNCSRLTAIDLPGAIAGIGADAFLNCSGLSSLKITPDAADLPNGILKGCTGLQSLSVPLLDVYDPVTCSYIKYLFGASTYSDDSVLLPKLQEIVVTGTPAALPSFAFFGLTALETVTLPESIAAIGESAFENCADLSELNLLATIPPRLDSDCLRGVSDRLTIRVPATSLDEYLNNASYRGFTIKAAPSETE